MNVPPIDYDSIAEIYDLYVTADYDLPFFAAEAARAGGPVLELTAGTGRLSIPLAQAGVPLTCVDASAAMLAVLSRKLLERHLHADVVCADICRLSLPSSFRLAFVPFQTFMELVDETQQGQVLAAVYSCLVRGGRFICTVHNPSVRRVQVDGLLRLVGRFRAGDGTLVVSGVEHGGHPVVSRLQFFEFFAADGRQKSRHLLPMQFTFIEKAQFETMAQEVGFRQVELYGNYDRSPFDERRSPFMIWVLEKGGH